MFKDQPDLEQQLEAWRILRHSLHGKELLPHIVESFDHKLRSKANIDPEAEVPTTDSQPGSASATVEQLRARALEEQAANLAQQAANFETKTTSTDGCGCNTRLSSCILIKREKQKRTVEELSKYERSTSN